MKLYCLFFLLFFTTLNLSAQIDSENKSIAIPAEKVDDPKADNEIIVQPTKRNDAKPKETAKEEVLLSKDEEMRIAKLKEFSMVHDDKLRSPAELFQKQLKRKTTTGGLVRPGEPVVGSPTHLVMQNLVMLWKMSPLRLVFL